MIVHELDGAERVVELAVGHEVEIAAVRIPRRQAVVGHVAGDLVALGVGQGIEVDGVEAVGRRLVVSDPLGVGAPDAGDEVAEALVLAVVHLDQFLLLDVDVVQVHRRVGQQQLLAVRAPGEVLVPDPRTLGQLGRLALAVRRPEVDLVFTAGVREVGDPLAVGAPGRIPLADAGGAGEVADLPLLGRHGEDVAAGLEQGPYAGGRQSEAMNVFADVLHRGPGGQIFAAHLNGELAGFLGLQVHDVQVPAVLIDDGAGT